MPEFPMPVGGEAWITGGVKGKVRGSNMRKSKRGSARRKPWESTNWIPYISQFNENPFNENNASTELMVKTTADQKRVFGFCPYLMNQETLVPSSTGRVATEESIKLLRMQGGIHFDGMLFLPDDPSDFVGIAQYGVTNMQAGVVQRVWYSWQKERMSVNGFELPVADLGVGPGVLSDVKQMQNRHLLSWGVLDWTRPEMNAAGTLVGSARGARSFRIPPPKLPRAGLKLGVGDMLSCIVRVSMGLMYSRSLLTDFAQNFDLPFAIQFQPMMRLLVSG